MTDEQILAIAGQLWRQNEGAEFTMDRLSDAAGVSRATLYRRFGSREAILQRLANEHGLDVQDLDRPDIPTRIVLAARTVFGRYGFAGVTIEQIAQEAEVGPATVYRHFGSKEKLIEAFVQASSPRQLMRNFIAGSPSDLEADLVTLATTALEFIQDNRGLLRVLLFENQESDSLLEQARATQGRTVTTLASYLADHMALGNLKQADPFALALSFIGMLIGLAFIGPHSYDHPITDTKFVAQFVTRIFLSGAAQQHPQKVKIHP
jgi:AcrR family transcriptional regulator